MLVRPVSPDSRARKDQPARRVSSASPAPRAWPAKWAQLVLKETPGRPAHGAPLAPPALKDPPDQWARSVLLDLKDPPVLWAILDSPGRPAPLVLLALKDPPVHHPLKHHFRSFPTPTLVISNLVLMVQPDPQAQMARPVVPVPLARPAPWERLVRPELWAPLAQLAQPVFQVEPASLDRPASMVPQDRKAQWATPA